MVAPTNASKWRMGFNSTFKWLRVTTVCSVYVCNLCVCVCVWRGVGHRRQFVAVELHNLNYDHYYWGDQIQQLDGLSVWNT